MLDHWLTHERDGDDSAVHRITLQQAKPSEDSKPVWGISFSNTHTHTHKHRDENEERKKRKRKPSIEVSLLISAIKVSNEIHVVLCIT